MPYAYLAMRTCMGQSPHLHGEDIILLVHGNLNSQDRQAFRG